MVTEWSNQLYQRRNRCNTCGMRIPVFFATLAGLVLTGCLPLSIYYREGVSVSRLERDTLNCEVSALKAAPVANQTIVEPPRWVAPRQVCDGNGVCHTQPGYFIPGETYIVDVNRSLRKKVEQQCMADKNYTPVKIPACSEGIKRAAPARATSTLPALSPQSCVIRYEGGSYQIVNKS
jgi:hypothetical protein